VLKEHVVTI